MCMVEFAPTSGGSHRKKPVSREELLRRKQLWKTIPALKQKIATSEQEEAEQADTLLNNFHDSSHTPQ